MAELVITPEGRDAIEAGFLIDEDGKRYVCVRFERPNDHAAIVTFTVPLFEDFARHMNNIATAARDESSWRDHPPL